MTAPPETERLYNAINLVLAGEPLIDSIAALKDQLAAVCCVMGENVQQALELAGSISDDLDSTICKNFDHYHSGARMPAPGRS